MQIVLDTNILFAGLSYKSAYFPIVHGIYKRTLSLLVSTPILLEYEEILYREHSAITTRYFFDFLNASDNVLFVNPMYRFQLPFEDEDDEKFVDCAVCGHADFLITNDRHFRRLKDIPFPKVTVIPAALFIRRHLR